MKRMYVGFTAVKPPLEEVQASDHHGQHVVEVVRDTASQLSYGFHLLRLPKLAFETFAARDLIECPLMCNAGHIFSIVGYLKLTLGIHQRQANQEQL